MSPQCNCQMVSLPCSQTFNGSPCPSGNQVQGLYNLAPPALKRHLSPLPPASVTVAQTHWLPLRQGITPSTLKTLSYLTARPHSPHLPSPSVVPPQCFLLHPHCPSFNLAFEPLLYPRSLPRHLLQPHCFQSHLPEQTPDFTSLSSDCL